MSHKINDGPLRSARNARMRIIAFKKAHGLSPRGPGIPLFFSWNMLLYRDLKLPEIMQSASHMYNGAALFARKDRIKILFLIVIHGARAEQYQYSGRERPLFQ